MSRRLATSAALLAAAALTVAGCSTSEGETVPSPQDRPSLDAVAADFAEAEERVHAVVSEILPDGQWHRGRQPWTSPCLENGEVVPDAERLLNGTWGFNAVPDDAQWTRIREELLPILADYGYTRVTMDSPVADGAAFKVAGAYEGSSFSIQYNKATAMSFRSGCHLPAGGEEGWVGEGGEVGEGGKGGDNDDDVDGGRDAAQ